jgi:pimeloyl-ACP methyl ester carboxylesterase
LLPKPARRQRRGELRSLAVPTLTTSDGVRLAVQIMGQGPSVVLVHGLASSVDICWRRPGVVDRLVAAGLRVVAFDLRGHGRSDAPVDEASYGDSRLAADVSEVVAAYADERAVLVGYSLGSALALVALAAGLRVRAAVLGAPPPAVARWTDRDEHMRAAAVAALRGDKADPLLAGWAARVADDGMQPAAVAALLARHRPVIRGWPGEVPVTFVVGRADALAAAEDDLVRVVPGSRVCSVEGDHISTLLAPELTRLVAAAAAA